MKTQFKMHLITVFAILMNATIYAQDPVDYMDKISEQAHSIREDFWDYTNAVSHGKSARKVDKKRTDLITTSEQALKTVKAMSGFNGSTEYRDSVASYLQMNLHILKEDYAKIVDMEEIAEKSYDNMEAYLMAKEEANKKRDEAADMLVAQEKKFAGQNNVELVEGEETDLTKKMKIAGEVYKYYNEIYLIFFKSYIQETYLIDAIGKSDVSGIEQNKNALLSTTEEGLNKLTEIKTFKGDNSLVIACRNILNFYKDEAANKVADITDFFLKTENFNTIKASFDQIKEKNRTQEDVDKYNKAVNEMNEAVNKYNATNESLSKERVKQIDNFNSTALKFTDTHVPKGKAK